MDMVIVRVYTPKPQHIQLVPRLPYLRRMSSKLEGLSYAYNCSFASAPHPDNTDFSSAAASQD